MSFQITILGSSSATPTINRHPSAQVVSIFERYFLVDCGEGTQMQIRKYKVKSGKINHIFISHLHGDHVLGLPGLLSSMHLMNRTHDLHLYCHRPLQLILETLFKYSETYLKFKIIYHFFDEQKSALLYEDDRVSVSSVILNHRIPCCGFIFKEKPSLLSIRKDKIVALGIQPQEIPAIKKGSAYTTAQGKIIPCSELTYPPRAQSSYAYCSDTKYDESLVESLQGINMLYHEATFMQDMLERANETYHTTAKQAAEFAAKCKVKKLLIGHFSARYQDLTPLLEEARSTFSETYLAVEGEIFSE